MSIVNFGYFIIAIFSQCPTWRNWKKNIINLLSLFLPHTKGGPSNPELEAVTEVGLVILSGLNNTLNILPYSIVDLRNLETFVRFLLKKHFGEEYFPLAEWLGRSVLSAAPPHVSPPPRSWAAATWRTWAGVTWTSCYRSPGSAGSSQSPGTDGNISWSGRKSSQTTRTCTSKSVTLPLLL